MRAKINLKGKEIIIEGIKKVSFLGKFIGLMFKKKETNALLFEFSKGKRAIHSFFCNPFLAIWLLGNKITEYKIISPNKLSVIPEKEFDKLIEVPINKKYSEVIRAFEK